MTDQASNRTDGPVDPAHAVELDAQAAEGIGGGLSCSPEDFTRLTASFKESYENLVDFTSHVIERVIGK